MGKVLIIKDADFSNVAVRQVRLSGMTKISVRISDDSPVGSGIVSGSGFYKPGEQAEISATSVGNYSFVRWNDGDTNPTRTITVGSEDTTFTAYFAQSIYTELTGSIKGGWVDEQLKYLPGPSSGPNVIIYEIPSIATKIKITPHATNNSYLAPCKSLENVNNKWDACSGYTSDRVIIPSGDDLIIDKPSDCLYIVANNIWPNTDNNSVYTPQYVGYC